jgi:hypothetical protein
MASLEQRRPLATWHAEGHIREKHDPNARTQVPMRWLPVVLVATSLGSPVSVTGQEARDSSRIPLRVATVTAGVGNSMGWFGLQGERYFAIDRASAFLGLGYTFATEDGDPTGLTFAAGLRGYTAGLKHRGFMEASVCQIFIERNFGLDEESSRLYGPCAQAGYQFASRGGFTAMVSFGVGYAPGVPEGQSGFGGLANLGVGYTWRR